MSGSSTIKTIMARLCVSILLVCFLTTIAGAYGADATDRSCLAPPSEFQSRVIHEEGIGKAVEAMSSLAGSYGPFWPLLVVAAVLEISPLYAASPNTPVVNGLSGLELAGIALAAAVLISVALYVVVKVYRSKQTDTKPSLLNTGSGNRTAVVPGRTTIDPKQPGQKQKSSLEDDMDRLLLHGRAIKSSTIDKNAEKVVWDELNRARPIAVFEQKITAEKRIRYELIAQYRDGKDVVSNQVLKRRNIKMQTILDVVRKIEKWIEREPNADLVFKLVIVDDDQADLHIVKRAGILVFPYSALQYEAMLETSGIAHELDHLAFSGYSPVEEIAVWAKESLRIFNVWRDGVNDHEKRRLFERFVKELPSYAIKYKSDYRENWINDRLQEIVRKEELRLRKKLTSEEIYWLVIPITWETMRDNLEKYVVIDQKDDVAKQMQEINRLKKLSGQQVLAEVKKLYEANKKRLLRGRPLYQFILPFCFVDFYNSIPQGPIIRIAAQLACVASIVYEGTIVRRLTEAAGGLYRAISDTLAPLPTPALPAPSDIFRSLQSAETSC